MASVARGAREHRVESRLQLVFKDKSIPPRYNYETLCESWMTETRALVSFFHPCSFHEAWIGRELSISPLCVSGCSSFRDNFSLSCTFFYANEKKFERIFLLHFFTARSSSRPTISNINISWETWVHPEARRKRIQRSVSGYKASGRKLCYWVIACHPDNCVPCK